MKISKFIHTLKYLKPVQIWGRLWFEFKRRALKPFIRFKVRHSKPPLRPKRFELIPRCYSKSAEQNLTNRIFTFLNVTANFSSGIIWNDPSKSKLWLYTLHYFEYLIPLTHKVNAENYQAAREILRDWLEKNPVGEGTGWEPYPISLRVVNWIFFYDAYFEFFEKEPEFKRVFLGSLYRQVAYLTYFFEKHLQANHLWANIIALMLSGLFLAHEKWISRGLKQTNKALPEQILPDSGHYERSPMYQALIIRDFIDLGNIVRNSKKLLEQYPIIIPMVRDLSGIVVQGMLEWLQNLTHSDGQYALLGDTAFDLAPTLDELVHYYRRVFAKFPLKSKPPKSAGFEDSGYFKMAFGHFYLILDGGPLGVRYQPGHAHCDLFSYELSYKRVRFIVDSGVGEYLPTDLRQKARSIYSHNTVVVNGMEQAEIWSAFRVGRWVEPENVTFQEGRQPLFEGSYSNDLNKKSRYKHTRTIRWENKYFVHDRIEGANIEKIENLLHVHPECRIEMQKGAIILRRNSAAVAIRFDAQIIEPEIRDWFYVPEFGKVLPSKMIVLQLVSGVTEMEYTIAGIA